MHTFPAKARTGTDGTLSLAIPTGMPDADVEVLVVFDVVPPATGRTDLAPDWAPGYFDEYFGALRGEGLIRHPQGETEERKSLD